MIKHRKRSAAVSMMLTALSASLVAVYLVLPGAWQWAHAEAKVEAKKLHQIVTVAPEVPGELVNRLRNTSTSPQAGPVIITYHDIGRNPSPYTVTPENFAAQMRLIHDAGWTTLTAAQLDSWLHGGPVPSHSVMITFDDGAKGVWQYADPVLAHYGQHAVTYIITGFVGTNQPYYMTWDEIAELQASGRWDIEAHTHLGHIKIPAGPNGEQGPFLTTLAWLPQQNRVETLAEYGRRVEADLAECKRQLIAHGLPQPRFFAYPFSADQGIPEVTEILRRTVGSLYHAAMLDDSDGIVATSSSDVAQGLVQRMDITADIDLDKFAHKLDLASPMDPLSANQPPLADAVGWVDEKGRPADIEVSEDKVTATINPDPGEEVVRNYAPLRSAMWNDYTVSADVGGFAIPGDDSMAGISVLKPPDGGREFPGRVDVTIHDNGYSVNVQGLVMIPPVRLFEAPEHHVVISVTDVQVIVTVDDAEPTVIDIPPHAVRTIGGGMALYAFRQSDTSPPLTFSNVTVS
jgi:poly-beta-1,6-N-acetyl-D-glucosamine N-deacetylase